MEKWLLQHRPCRDDQAFPLTCTYGQFRVPKLLTCLTPGENTLSIQEKNATTALHRNIYATYGALRWHKYRTCEVTLPLKGLPIIKMTSFSIAFYFWKTHQPTKMNAACKNHGDMSVWATHHFATWEKKKKNLHDFLYWMKQMTTRQITQPPATATPMS